MMGSYLADMLDIQANGSRNENWSIGRQQVTEQIYAELRDRLDDVSQALSEVGRTTRKVSEGLSRLVSDDSAQAAARTVERVCRKCQMKNTCWQFSYAETMEALSLALSTTVRGRQPFPRA